MSRAWIGLHEIDITNLTFTYENRQSPALQDLTVAIDRNEFVLLAGASGSGKSTLLKCINGLIPHRYLGQYSGEVRVRNTPVARTRFLDLSLTVGTVLQEADKQLVSSLVEDDVAFGPSNLALARSEIQQRVTESLAAMDILHLRDRSIFTLSGGQKQRIAIADILAMKPDILLFDEPLANLDSGGVKLMQDIFEKFHEAGKTLLVAEHRTEEVLRAGPTRVLVINDGRIVADGNPEVLMDFGEMLKVPAEYVLRMQPRFGPPEQYTAQELPARPINLHLGRGKELVRVEDVIFEYSGGIQALRQVSFSISEGERIALLGNNGAGKSTLALCIVGLLKPTSGRILISGMDTRNLSPAEIARQVCLVFQSPFSMLFAKTVLDELSFGPRNVEIPENEISKVVPETAKQCKIEHLLDKSPFASSFGEKKRICVASVLTMGPKCVILDEPTAGQDFRSYSNFMKFIQSISDRVSTFVVITHDPDLAIEYTDRAIVLRAGSIITDGPTRTVLADPSVLREGSIRETSLIELSRKLTSGKAVLPLAELRRMHK